MDRRNFVAFVEQQRERGALDSSGSFTVDADRARFKLGRYQLDSPAAYLLMMVQAGVLARCRSIKIHAGYSNLKVSSWNPWRSFRKTWRTYPSMGPLQMTT